MSAAPTAWSSWTAPPSTCWPTTRPPRWRCTGSTTTNDATRSQTTLLRYELQSTTEDLTEDRTWRLHWYSQAAFRSMAEAAGLAVAGVFSPEGRRATPDDDAFVFLLNAPG